MTVLNDPVKLEIFRHLLDSVADEMGVILRNTSYSPNIKERCDFSCALFDSEGNMVAQAAHIPVHLGAMPLSVQAVIRQIKMLPGDVVMVNDPFMGGTHLPDITLIAPVFYKQKLMAFVANRAHHSDIGGMSPGSMPLSIEIYQEGMIVPPVKLVNEGELNEDILNLLLANVRTPNERSGDIRAQISANSKGITRILELLERYGSGVINSAMSGLLAYTERVMRDFISTLPDGEYCFYDVMDDDGNSEEEVKITTSVRIMQESIVIDFTGSSNQVEGNINATKAITIAAVFYVFRSLIQHDIPTNSGCLLPIEVIAPEGTIVNAIGTAAVAAGNVETSQRITDVILGAMSKVCGDKIPAASQGTMNNITIGGIDHRGDNSVPFAYYETIGGGMGANPTINGSDAIHTHMTNTLNTPIEALEYAYPMRVKRYAVRCGSGGFGLYCGGNGIVREIEMLTDARVTILSDRRIKAPYGLSGGESGKPGRNYLISNNKIIDLPGKTSIDVVDGDIIGIRTPGGGGFGVSSQK